MVSRRLLKEAASAPLPRHTRVKEYYVYDPATQNLLAGQPITVDGEKRTVKLTEAEAQYWLDQGTIGDKPFDQQSEKGQKVLGQALKLEGHAPEPTARRAKPRARLADQDLDRSPLVRPTTGTGDTIQGPGQKGRRS